MPVLSCCSSCVQIIENSAGPCFIWLSLKLKLAAVVIPQCLFFVRHSHVIGLTWAAFAKMF